MAFKLPGPSLYPNIKLSRTGYKKDSPDVDNPQNLIPSGDITMEDVEFPVHGVDNLGNEKVMEPGKNYEFAGSQVLETPLAMHKGVPHWKSKAKYRKDGTLKKVITKDHLDCDDCENYKSTIKFDKEGHIKSAKNNKTKDKYKKSTQRLSRAKWIKRDMTPYGGLAGERW